MEPQNYSIVMFDGGMICPWFYWPFFFFHFNFDNLIESWPKLFIQYLVCNFCNGLVTWIIERDPKGKFKFCSLQSEIGHEYLDKYKLPKDLSTIVLIEPGNHTYTKWVNWKFIEIVSHNNLFFFLNNRSDAVFRILSQLDSPFAYLSFLRYTPRCIRDLGYDIFGSLR